jgi:hypothetical protein
MKTPPQKIEKRAKRELLRELFVNAISLALIKEAALVPVRVEARGERRRLEIPDYYRG